MLEGFVNSDRGYAVWIGHRELDVQIAESQSEWTPLQKRFLELALDEYGPDKKDIPNDVNNYG